MKEELEHALITELPPDDWVLVLKRVASFTGDWRQATAALIRIIEWSRDGWYLSTNARGEFRALAKITRMTPDLFERSVQCMVQVSEPSTKLNRNVKLLEWNARESAVQTWIIG